MTDEGQEDKRAGGRAVEGGMAFQADVGTWFAAHILARLPIGARFGINNSALPTAIRFETSEGLDDILVTQSDGGDVYVQCKTSANLTARAKSPLEKTVTQLVKLFCQRRQDGRPLDPVKSVAVLAVSLTAPKTLFDLEVGCRTLDMGGDWTVTKDAQSAKVQDALEIFKTIVTSAWTSASTEALKDSDLVELARIFRVARFNAEEGGADWREASRVLGVRVYTDEAAGDKPLKELRSTVRRLIKTGGEADRAGLLRELRKAGHNDVRSPVFDADVAALTAATERELNRLGPHTQLPIGSGIPILRDCTAALATSAGKGPFLVVGEPGAGKTGALVAFAEALRSNGEVVVFLSVDRLQGVRVGDDLRTELGLIHPLITVLANWPRNVRKTLIIDALDASRGGPAEAVFAATIEEAVKQLAADWVIIASIRTFDLKNGQRFKAILRGPPPDSDYVEGDLGDICHFRIPRLSDKELSDVAAASSDLGTLVKTAPPELKTLLRNVFNLSLAAELIARGVEPDTIRSVRTQSDLIDRYENERLPSSVLQQGAKAVVTAMVERRRLIVRKMAIESQALDAVIGTGVLADLGDLVSFAHHVLFDHVAGRFFLEWDTPAKLKDQIAGDGEAALLLAPALRFAIERLWRQDDIARSQSWSFLAAISRDEALDPVVSNVALRTAIENVTRIADVGRLIELIRTVIDPADLKGLLSRLARFVALSFADKDPTDELCQAWAEVAATAAARRCRDLADGARFLLMTLEKHISIMHGDTIKAFGRASRELLSLAWTPDNEMPILAVNAIAYVSRSFGTDPTASKLLLDQILRDPRFEPNAHAEAPGLAENVLIIAQDDPAFAAEIYRVLYGRDVSKDDKTWLGGTVSQILPLSSSRRQDYHMARWHLGKAIGQFLSIAPAFATRAIVDASLGDGGWDEKSKKGGLATAKSASGGTFQFARDEFTSDNWDDPSRHAGSQEDNVLAHFVAFLKGCSEEQLRQVIESACRGYSSCAVLTRIIGVAASPANRCNDVLWPLATQLAIIGDRALMRDAVAYVAAAYPHRSHEERETFEMAALAEGQDEQSSKRWNILLSRLLLLLSADDLATDEMRALRAKLDSEGGLRPNNHAASFRIGWGGTRDLTRELLQSQGVDVEATPNAAVIGASDALSDEIRQTPIASDAEKIGRLWTKTVETVAILDLHANTSDEHAAQSAWGAVGNAAERIAKAPAYDPANSNHPSLDQLLALLKRLADSPYPKVEEEQRDDELE